MPSPVFSEEKQRKISHTHTHAHGHKRCVKTEADIGEMGYMPRNARSHQKLGGQRK